MHRPEREREAVFSRQALLACHVIYYLAAAEPLDELGVLWPRPANVELLRLALRDFEPCAKKRLSDDTRRAPAIGNDRVTDHFLDVLILQVCLAVSELITVFRKLEVNCRLFCALQHVGLHGLLE